MFPRWLSLLFLIVLAVMLVQTGRHGREAASAGPSGKAARSYEEINKFTDVERWKKAIDPAYAQAMQACAPPEVKPGRLGVKVSIDTPGEGEVARCGQPLALHVARWDAHGNITREKDITFVLGQSGVPGLDAALMETKPGEARTLTLLPQTVAKESPFRVLVVAGQVNLLTVTRR